MYSGVCNFFGSRSDLNARTLQATALCKSEHFDLRTRSRRHNKMHSLANLADLRP
jgi:hypothetical protein